MFHTYHPVLQYHKNSCLPPSTIRHAIVYHTTFMNLTTISRTCNFAFLPCKNTQNLRCLFKAGCLVEKNEAYLLNKKFDRMLVLTLLIKLEAALPICTCFCGYNDIVGLTIIGDFE